jgi:hypothetical protein
MSTAPMSHRTVVRNVVMETLTNRVGDVGMRLPQFDVAANYLSPEECKRFPTYCVVVTDETPAVFTLQQIDCALLVMLVLYVRHETDVRAMLDAAIEDVYDTMLLVEQSLIGTVWQMALTTLTTDESTTIAKPYAQAVQRWSCHHGRSPRAA